MTAKHSLYKGVVKKIKKGMIRMFEDAQYLSEVLIESKNHVQYSIDFTKTMTALEARLHNCEDPTQIAMDVLKVAAEFYNADWCGIIEGDLAGNYRGLS